MNIRKGRLFLAFFFAGAFVSANAFAGIDQAAVDKCKSCHEETVTKFLGGAHHGKVWGKTDADKKYSCDSCHGPSEQHIAAGGSKETIIRFEKGSKNTVAEQNAQCMNCHKKAPQLAMWEQGKHKSHDVSCSSCHAVHKDSQAKNPETCFTCHKNVRMQVSKLSHHPIVEGKVSCSDCHNPHGALSHGMIKADNVNQLCYKCHADKRGPFIWEHEPVEEDCSKCHTPHGSNHYSLLTKRLPALCQDCHGSGHGLYVLDNNLAMGKPPTANSSKDRGSKFVKANSCMGCHGKIHGSNAPNSTHGNGKSWGGKAFLR